LGTAARIAHGGGDDGLLGVGLVVGRPVQPMLAATAASIAEAIEQVGEASVEWKLDGARIQVHRRGDEVRIFTRNLNEITERLPQVVEIIRSFPGTECVLDGEILGLDPDGRPRPFQDTMSRFGSDEVGAGVGLQPYFFDVLHLNGRSLLDEPLAARQDALAELAPNWRLPTLRTADPQLAATFGAEALEAGHEGVMVKAIYSLYDAGRRGSQWLKVKPVRTLDLVVLAAEWGHGRRTGSLSNLHLGARDPDGGFVMVGKTFKGLTDELLRWQTEALQQLATTSTDDWVVHVRPELVVEIAVDGVQVSRRYPGGVALRFARVRGYRPDRSPNSADTIENVRSLLATGAAAQER
jgi:DNA ligase 1